MKIKVCGMRDEKNILEVLEEPPDYMGFIFYKKSSRYAGEMPPAVTAFIPGYVCKTGVFVNATLDEIKETVEKYQLDSIQLHGAESPEFCEALKSLLDSREISIIKVFSVGEDFDFERLKPFDKVVDFYLFDTKGKLPGGNGYTFDWTLLKNYSGDKPYFLSGGIAPEHFKDIQSLDLKGLYAIDINSKFEIEPALKDFEKTGEFVKKIHEMA
ncbi:phosphoribosylanthranilate isomerase [Chondrinema litorale]|uniref:phosphoribosylanthranilate isomerase n=1 Tax=Chondrinema litorale TaxID=2994555 RepID=UPI0025428B54|nr:phosphoribosylanthranilate isomerase [Chondrinema litorale]UZR93838.1 phosphoribosylanthranilate isomerase [Chondrinema litorale]